MKPQRTSLFCLCALPMMSVACGGSPPPAASPKASISAPAPDVVEAADRDPKDRAMDAGRHPGELLAFAGIRPGMHVAELFAGGGYTSELLARAVGPDGVVYAENNRFILDRYAAKPWSERLAKPVMRNVVRVDRELDDPLPPGVGDLDAVFLVLAYHDTVWMGTDRDKMNRAIFAALKPGGEFIVVDHSAKDGDGIGVAKTLHRIEKSVVLAEVAKAGFKLAKEGAFLRNASDTRDWNDSPVAAGDRRGTSDRFVLAFVKP